MISFSQDSCLASNGCPPPLGIPNRDSTCYAAVALHVLASVHDTSVTGVVLPNISLPSGTVQKIVATISAGGSVGQHNMGRLLSLVEGADYETGKQQVGPSGSGGMVAAAVLALGPVPAQALPLSRKRARRGTQTKEGQKAVVAERKRRQRERERGREEEEGEGED